MKIDWIILLCSIGILLAGFMFFWGLNGLIEDTKQDAHNIIYDYQQKSDSPSQENTATFI